MSVSFLRNARVPRGVPAKTKKATTGKVTKRPAKAAKRTATAPAKRSAKAARPRFGRPGTAGKGEGDAAVRALIAGVRPEQRALVERLDAIIGDAVPDVKRAVKWSMPMYGREGLGYFAHVAPFKAHVALGFFAGDRLDPPLPDTDGKGAWRVKFATLADVDERLVPKWVAQASTLRGWSKV